MGDCVCRIERLANGYEVEMRDPKIVEENNKSKGRWRDPMVGHAFKDVKDLCAFLEKNLEAAGSTDEYSSSFDTAMAEDV
jgi:hypothetical protein